MKQLTKKTVKGVIWISTAHGIQIFLRLAVVAILARMLTPSDFGTLAAALLFIGVGEILACAGAGEALIQVKDLQAKHINAAFTLGLFAAGLFIPILILAAYLVETIMRIDNLGSIVALLSFCILLKPAEQITSRVLQRDMVFMPTAICDVVSYLFGYGLIGILLAYFDFAYMALVWAHLASVVANTILLMLIARLKLRPNFGKEERRQLLSFGTRLTTATILEFLSDHAPQAVIASFFGAAALGFYTRANFLALRIGSFAHRLSVVVLYPAFALRNSELDKLKSAFMRATSLLAIALFPLAVIASILADELIVGLLLGDQWSKAVLPFQILVLLTPIRVIRNTCTTMLNSIGDPASNIVLNLSYLALASTIAVSLMSYGLAGIATSALIAIVISTLMSLRVLIKSIGVSWNELRASAWTAARVASLAGGGALAAKLALIAIGISNPLLIVIGSCTLAGLLCVAMLVFAHSIIIDSKNDWIVDVLADGWQKTMTRFRKNA